MRRPNLLFIFTDEQRADTMAAYRNTLIDMPNLNRLGAESFVFERAYVTQPVCTPSRSSILTGLWPHTNGCTSNNIRLPDEMPCLPELLPHGEYATAYHGKWHLGDELFAQHGFDEWISIEDGYNKWFSAGHDPDTRSDYHRFLVGKGFAPQSGRTFGRSEAAHLPEAFGKPAFLAREASRFIRENRARPFCLFVNFLEPHMPFTGPRDGQYDPARVTLPPNFENPPDDSQPLRTRVLQRAYCEDGHGGMSLRTEADWRRLIANYWGLCSLVDTHVGTILATLDECGLAGDTIVVYTSDHGDMMGSHRLLAKTVMFEEAVRVPLLVRLPGQRVGRRVGGAISQIDLVPTLLDLAAVSVSNHLQGTSGADVFRSGSPRAEGDVFVEWNGRAEGVRRYDATNAPPWLAELGSFDEIEAAMADSVRTIITPDGWKFNCSVRGEHELYDLNADPYETRNLARRAPNDETRGRMRDLADHIRRWQERTEDVVTIPAI